ncbi:amino acid-binding protein [Anaeromyxobacter oryzisoli]|jgi:hypothetical protein|uniref:amino acid-binding protein n=1 Tax=Anaeromyxobacter oryzisoli TaxID=2925408 RepID=UPI001F561D4B|nr:amino acid-binding protein [Anaeromyxobacter sp. SG63]
MQIRQLSLFLENKPGQLRIPAKVLGDAGIDILTMSLADTHQFGILRLVVKDTDRARAVLEDAGVVVNVTDVLAVDVPDRPGGLASVLEAFENAGLGIEYMYPFATRERGRYATLLFRLEDPAKAASLLQQHGVRLVSPAELFARAG